MNSYTRRYEASRAAKYGLKEKTLPSIPETEILYFSQGILEMAVGPQVKMGYHHKIPIRSIQLKHLNAQDQSTDILFVETRNMHGKK